MSLPYLPPNGLAVNEWNDTDAAFRSCLQEVIQFLELPSDDPSFELPQKRAWMLERLSQIYNDSLRSSWQHIAWSKLGLSENSAAILNVSQRLLRCIDQDEYPLSPGTSIRQAFDDAKQELLILGRPGVGKSTLLLELAQSLLRRAENDEQAPLPVVVHLLSWAAKGLPIHTWLSEQISQTYSIPEEESQLQQQIWKDYVKRVIAQRESSAHYPWRQSREWLSWLAQQMQARHEPIFFLELLQPDCLPRKQRILYQLSCGLVLGLASTLIGALIFGAFGALAGSVLGMLIGTLNRSIRLVEAFSWSWKRTRSALPGGLLLGLTGGLIATIVYGLLVWFSWFPAGPVIGLFYVMMIVLPVALPIGLPTGILGGLLGAVIYGFSRKQPFEHSPDFARTGIRRSVLNGLVGGLLGGLLGSLLGELPALLTIQTALVLPGSLAGLLIGALVFGLWAATQHLLLRLWLWQSKQFPRNLFL